jgi:hypothetical protein
MEMESAPGNPVVLVGQEDGSVVLRDVGEKLAAVAVLNAGRNAGHTAAVRVVLPGPSDYFFSGGNDGRMCVWQAIIPQGGAADGGGGGAPGPH